MLKESDIYSSILKYIIFMKIYGFRLSWGQLFLCGRKEEKRDEGEFYVCESTLMVKGEEMPEDLWYFCLTVGKYGENFFGATSFVRSCGRRSAQMDSFEIVLLRLKATKFHLDFLTAVSSFRKQWHSHTLLSLTHLLTLNGICWI